jgi:hypothetical protein
VIKSLPFAFILPLFMPLSLEQEHSRSLTGIRFDDSDAMVAWPLNASNNSHVAAIALKLLRAN